MKPKSKSFSPQNLRTLLATLLVLIVLGGGGAFYLGLEAVREHATEVDRRLADADASAKQLNELKVLKNQLAQSTSLVEKANSLFVSPELYQQRTLADLAAYAQAANLTIASTSFGNATETGTHTVIVELRQPVSYSGLITFLNSIESNLPKLQVSSISLGSVAGGDSNSVKTGKITIDISVR